MNPCSCKSHRDATAGISLLEMLVALAVMAFLAVLSVTTLEYSARSLSIAGGSSRSADIAVSRNTLRTWLERALFNASVATNKLQLSGDKRGVTFTAVLDDGVIWPGEAATVELTEAADHVISAKAVGLSEGERSPVTETITLSGSGGAIKIEYFGSDPVDAYPDWHDRWATGLGLPKLLRLSISDAETIYPPLIIEPGKEFRQRESSLSSLLPSEVLAPD